MLQVKPAFSCAVNNTVTKLFSSNRDGWF